MLRLFGVDITEIKKYDFDKFMQDHISIDNLTLEEFSESLDKPGPNTNGEFIINQGTKKYREIILWHLCSRVNIATQPNSLEEIGIKELPEWDDESDSLWSEITKCIEDGKFDSYIVNNSNNYNLLKWIDLEFKYSKPSRGQVATNRQSWKSIISTNKISPMHLAAWKIMNKVITKIHDYRSQFSLNDEFYLSVYDALNLSIDISGMRIFHEVLEDSITANKLLNFEEKYISTTKKYSELFEKGKDSLPAMLNQLEKHWLVRDVDRTSHKFKTSRGASIIGAMIHASYLMQTQWANSLRRRDSILRTIEKQLKIYYKTSTKGLHTNVKEYWLKYHLQDPFFRELLSKILDSGKDTYTAQLEGTIPEFLSKLLMMDFVAMTDKNWKSSSRRDPGINGFKADFSGSEVDRLTRSIVNQCDKFLSSSGSRFFSIFIEDLDKFLDLSKIERDYKKESSKKGKENLTEESFKRQYPSKYINQDLWKTWEWLLNLMSNDIGSGLYDRWTGIHDKQNIDARKLRKVRRASLHSYLRLNSTDGYAEIQEQVYRSQYLDIKKDLRTTNKKGFIFHANNLLDFCEGSINQSNDGIDWSNVQRTILNHAIMERGYPEYYIDWDICLQLYSRLKPEVDNDIEYFLGQAIDAIMSVLEHIVPTWDATTSSRDYVQQSKTRVRELAIEEILLNPRESTNESGLIVDFSSRLKNAHILLKDTLGLDSQSNSLTSKRIKKSYFNSERNHQKFRDLISGEFLHHLMSEVAAEYNENPLRGWMVASITSGSNPCFVFQSEYHR